MNYNDTNDVLRARAAARKERRAELARAVAVHDAWLADDDKAFDAPAPREAMVTFEECPE